MAKYTAYPTHWISKLMAGRLLECPSRALPSIAAAAGWRILVLPGQPTKYHRADVEATAAASVVRAGQRQPA